MFYFIFVMSEGGVSEWVAGAKTKLYFVQTQLSNKQKQNNNRESTLGLGETQRKVSRWLKCFRFHAPKNKIFLMLVIRRYLCLWNVFFVYFNPFKNIYVNFWLIQGVLKYNIFNEWWFLTKGTRSQNTLCCFLLFWLPFYSFGENRCLTSVWSPFFMGP